MTAEAAAERLVQWMDDPTVDMRERVKIAQDLLGRAGVATTDRLLIGLKVGPVEDLFRRLLADDDAIADPADDRPKALPQPDRAQAAQDRLEGAVGAMYEDDVEEAEIVAEEPPPAPSGLRPPKHIREALARLL